MLKSSVFRDFQYPEFEKTSKKNRQMSIHVYLM